MGRQYVCCSGRFQGVGRSLEATPESIGGQALMDPAQKRFQRINELLKLLTLLDGLAQRFFESHKGLREAVEMLASEE